MEHYLQQTCTGKRFFTETVKVYEMFFGGKALT